MISASPALLKDKTTWEGSSHHLNQNQDMKKTQYGISPDIHRVLIKCLLMTKIVILLILAFSTQGFARGQGISLKLEKVQLKKALKAIEEQGDFRFVYRDQLLKGSELVGIKVENASLDEV